MSTHPVQQNRLAFSKLTSAFAVLVLFCLTTLIPLNAFADDSLVALIGGKVYPISSAPIDDGVVLIKNGKITAVGKKGEVKIPNGTPLVNLEGRSVMPGLVDMLSAWPLVEDPQNEYSVQPHFDVIDNLNPYDAHIPVLLREGITSVGIVPKSRGSIGILGGVIKLGPGSIKKEAEGPPAPQPENLEIVSRRAYLTFELGRVSSSLGTASTTTTDRLNQFYSLRSLLDGTVSYKKQWEAYRKNVVEYNKKVKEWKKAKEKAEGKGKKPEEKKPEGKKPEPKKEEKKPSPKASGADQALKDPPKTPPQKKPTPPAPAKKPPAKPKPAPKPPTPPRMPRPNNQYETLLRVLDGKLPLMITAHRRDDIAYALKLKEDFNLKNMVVLGGTEGFRNGDHLKKAGVSVSVSPVLLRVQGLRYLNHKESNSAELDSAGVPVAISSLEDGFEASKYLRWQAAVAVRGGLNENKALRAITLEPAKILGVDKRVGSLEVGKDADLIVIDGDPLDVQAKVLRVMVNGQFSLSREMEF